MLPLSMMSLARRTLFFIDKRTEFGLEEGSVVEVTEGSGRQLMDCRSGWPEKSMDRAHSACNSDGRRGLARVQLWYTKIRFMVD